jgi:hypothetical protein
MRSVTKTLAQIVGIIVDELSPLGSDDRRRAIKAAMTLLGEETVKSEVADTDHVESEEAMAFPPRVRTWMRQNDLSVGALQNTFHVENGAAEFIAEAPGSTNKDKVRNAYILTGISNFLVTGDQRFDDAAARAFCVRFGFYDRTNHSKYIKGGNEFTGTRERGWTLTIPGLKAGANLIKEIGNLA